MNNTQSKIDQIISELCPNGVKFKELSELGVFYGGLTGKSKGDFSNGNAKFITYMNIFSNISVDTDVDIFVKIEPNEKQNKIQYGDVLFTGSSENADECGMSSVLTKKTDEPLYLNSFCFGFRLHDINLFSPEFLKYLFRDEQLRKQIAKTANGVTRFNISKKRFAKIKIPIPPLAIQEEIVDILDKFTQLEAELEAELEARKKQYEYYRDEMLSFGDGVEICKLEQIAFIGTGSHDTKDAVKGGKFTFYARGREQLLLDSYDFEEEATITAGDGAGVGKVFHFANGKYALHQRAYRIVANDNIYSRYLHYYIVSKFPYHLEQVAVSSSVTSLRRKMFTDFNVSVPSLEEQKRIVSILDKFDALVNDISIGLPAEIKARRKQYEHYRGKLLTFKELENER